MDVKLEIFIYI